jgi:hypothetical protein
VLASGRHTLRVLESYFQSIESSLRLFQVVHDGFLYDLSVGD